MDKATAMKQAIKHLTDLGYDAGESGGVLYIYYKSGHYPEGLMQTMEAEVKKIGYNHSFGVKARSGSKFQIDKAEPEAEGATDED